MDEDYNCIAWAASDVSNWWEPSGYGHHYWPDRLPVGAPNAYTLENYINAFRTRDFEPCDELDLTLEAGLEKVLLFTDRFGTPTHAARQLPSGAWTSKLGQYKDIEHEFPDGVGGDPGYGAVAIALCRPGDDVARAPAS